MKATLEKFPEQPLVVPENIITINIDSGTGRLTRGKGISEYFVKGTEPTSYASPTTQPSFGGTSVTDDLF